MNRTYHIIHINQFKVTGLTVARNVTRPVVRRPFQSPFNLTQGKNSEKMHSCPLVSFI